MAVPPEVELVVLLYHWKVGVPVPFCVVTLKALNVPSKQTVWVVKGGVEKVGAAFTVIVAIADISASPVQVTPDTPLGFNYFVFNAIGQTVTLMYTYTGWVIISNRANLY